MSFEDYRDFLSRKMMAQRVIGQEVSYRITIPEPELKKYYDEHPTEFVRKEQVYLSQILLSAEGKGLTGLRRVAVVLSGGNVSVEALPWR